MTASDIHQIAYLILKGFEKSYRWHTRITTGAQERFEHADWQGVQQAVRERISIYDQAVTAAVSEIYQLVHPHQQDKSFWQRLKQRYLTILDAHPQFELAETFYNSIIGRIFKHQKINNDMMFVQPSRCYLAGQVRHTVVNTYDATGTVQQLLHAILKDYRFNRPFEDKERDFNWCEQYLRQTFSRKQLASVTSVEILHPIFFRNKGAYLVGRMCAAEQSHPFVLALLLNDNGELYIDTLLTERHDLSGLFGFARSYFMADTQYPAEVVAFLQELLPNKKHFELYISLGFYKHGKTVFYRNFLQHLSDSHDQFEVAPGIRGLVMAVFHLPSYGVVFKIIKDEFGESKKFGREHVVNRYKLVKMHDRVGRMADTHEYVNFRLPLNRVSDELLQELREQCANSIEIGDDSLIIKHAYIEKKLTPLNLYLDHETDPDKITHALNDLGRCIKQIAAANIFPGDMLHKNFGITRHGKVIFYDYDEICYMNERRFQRLPQSDDPYALDTLSVAPDDVFPEQFRHFIVGKKPLKDELMRLHPELTDPDWWQQVQKEVSNGLIKDVSPYPKHKRFALKFGHKEQTHHVR
ncbi:Isocitrate dehydrogenase kinase/phosphatase [Saliniradius amylolyticus]|uniref:Isocitrate dehydrogenase kinase/phosphatase n=1 Tax=Saliniradius amylolyticus TaxID=2183582 RepID=A0A2S2E5L4_9ALTE|nr:bifunctional isocitrate dehydrogenase kinase/phosphatase [Saliniradius amylolyticus]AWL12889.1 Isocitrate dehydrogenase kinase/phosphatase [Saliniradius amylolyticus]